MALQFDTLVDDDGLSLDALEDWCPATSAIEQSPADASRCQRRALACSVDAAMEFVVPRAGEILARLGLDADTIGGCAATSRCGDGIEDDEEECDDGAGNSDTAPDACRSTCTLPYCGDGVVDSDEECEDGNTLAGDGCEPDCTITDADEGLCGDGIVQDTEDCDDGLANSDTAPDACRTTCASPSCGDGVVDSDEECEDGNHIAGDGCEPDCTITEGAGGICGDGIMEGTEVCDDGADNSDTAPDACRTTCRSASCGDGVVDGDEECDDGNRLPGDGCEPLCTITPAPGGGLCGNGVVDPDEDCDPPLVGLCDALCHSAVPAVPVALGIATRGQGGEGDVQACQAAVLRGGARVFARGRVLVAHCVAVVDACLAMPDEDGRRDRCLARADRTCTAVAGARDQLRRTTALRAAAHCEAAGVGTAGLLDAHTGIGLASSSCDAGATAGGLIDCAYASVQCVAETAVAKTVPRAPGLFDELELDVDAVFPCLVGDE